VFALVDPDPRLHRSFLEAADEFIAVGEHAYANLLAWPPDDGFDGIAFTRDGLEDPAEFTRFADFLLRQRREDAPRPATFVPYTEMWMSDGSRYLGRITLRHRLTDVLFTWGGHIGYGVRPGARGRGYATRALAEMLPLSAALGIGTVLVTCDVDNEASRRTIETNGGVYEDTRQGKLRYWITVLPGAVRPTGAE
jgi:predicted acetyltransferase